MPREAAGNPSRDREGAEAGPEHSLPLAYFITFTCYGRWLHGKDPLSVDDEHNLPGAPFIPADARREEADARLMDQPAYELDGPRREVVLKAIEEVAAHRHWTLFAAHVRRTHVHVVIQAGETPEKVMNDFKAYASRRLREAGFDGAQRKRWSRHGSTRYLWTPEDVSAAVQYVVCGQGEPMAVLNGSARRPISERRVSEPRP